MNGSKKNLMNKKTGRSVLVAISAVLLCVLMLLLPFSALYPRLSGERLYHLSSVSKAYLQGIDRDVEIVYYANGGKLYADRGLYRYVKQIAKQSDHIKLRLEDPEITGADVENNSIELRVGEKSKTLLKTDLIYYYSASAGPLSIEEYGMALSEMQISLQYIQSGSYTQQDITTYQEMAGKFGTASMSSYNMAEKIMTTAIRNLLAEESPTVYAYGLVNSLFCANLEQRGYTVTVLDTLDTIPVDCEALYLSVISDLSEGSAAALTDYLGRGGKVFMTTDYRLSNMPNLSAVLATYGMSFYSQQNLICSVTASQDSTGATTTSIRQMLTAAVSKEHSITEGLGGMVAHNAHIVIYDNKLEGVTITPLAASADGAYLLDPSKTSPVYPSTGAFPFCALAEKGDSALLWLGMPISSEADTAGGGANFTMAAQGFDYLTGFDSHEIMEGISDVEIPSAHLTLPNSDRTILVWFAAFVIVIPVAVIVAGLVRRYTRRKRTE